MTDVDRLDRAGRLLYGAQWQTPMAEDLGVALRTVQRWATGAIAPPAGIWRDLKPLLERHGKESLSFAKTICSR